MVHLARKVIQALARRLAGLGFLGIALPLKPDWPFDTGWKLTRPG